MPHLNHERVWHFRLLERFTTPNQKIRPSNSSRSVDPLPGSFVPSQISEVAAAPCCLVVMAPEFNFYLEVAQWVLCHYLKVVPSNYCRYFTTSCLLLWWCCCRLVIPLLVAGDVWRRCWLLLAVIWATLYKRQVNLPATGLVLKTIVVSFLKL